MTPRLRTSLHISLLVSLLGVPAARAQTPTPQYAPPQYAPPYAPPQYAPPQYAPPQYAPPQYAPPQYAPPQYVPPQNPPQPAVPTQPPVNHWDGEIALEGVVGLAGPYGPLGIAIDYSPTPWFVLNAGVGLSMQAGITPRFRVPLSNRVGLGVELGVSAGPYKEFCMMCEHDGELTPTWDPAIWLNGAAVVDLRTPGGFHFRGFLGQERLLNREDCYTDAGEECRLDSGSYIMPYLGAAFGGVLGL